jgi:D-alanyl-D-alanine carboxypeptidase (penicillin-binding protein 5/6)
MNPPCAPGPPSIFCSRGLSEIALLSRMFPLLSRRPLLLAVSIVAGAVAAVASTRTSAQPGGTTINPDAFRSAIVIDAATGKVLFEDRADVQTPPASVTKLMTFYLVECRLKEGAITLDTPVTVTAEASHTGGSRVWLVDKEKITLDEMLYALMVQSANDAAVALADQLSGSKAAFVELMNLKARDLGMTHTVYHSPHGLPPSRGQDADLSTARDIATLCRKLLLETDVLKYSATQHHDFRHQNGIINKLDTHNHLLAAVPGCDGLKTGYYAEAGFSLAATVQRNGRRIIVVVLGSPSGQGRHPWELRDTVTTQLIERGFAALPPAPPPVSPAAGNTGVAPAANPATPAVAPAPPAAAAPAPADETTNALKPVPVGPSDQKAPSSDSGSAAPTVHINLPGAKH